MTELPKTTIVTILTILDSEPDGISRDDLFARLNARNQKKQQATLNELWRLKKSGAITLDNGKYKRSA